MPVRECLCRICRGPWPLLLSAATPLGGDTTPQLQLGRQANFYYAECTRQRLYRELSRASRVAKGKLILNSRHIFQFAVRNHYIRAIILKARRRVAQKKKFICRSSF